MLIDRMFNSNKIAGSSIDITSAAGSLAGSSKAGGVAENGHKGFTLRVGPAADAGQLRSAGKVSPAQCETCKNRRYVDGSDEGNVSFKAPTHISPGASAATVSSHEQEHVANAQREGNEEGKELISASVALKMAVCPECGTAYISGGVTSTTMKVTSSEATPYGKANKLLQGSILTGMNVDERV